ncbi:SNF2 family amino-terminal protein, partial [Rhizoctonia solani AG-3 Rhs1AP]
MPTLPLGQFLLPFLTNVTPTLGPYDIFPWTSETWRTVAGLEPLPANDNPTDQTARASQGLRLTPLALNQLESKYRKALSESQLVEADKFMDRIYQRVLKTVAQSQPASTAIIRPENITGWAAYQGAITALIRRQPGGVMWQVEDVLELGFSTPRHAWIGLRQRNMNLPEGERKDENISVPAPRAYVDSKDIKAQVAIPAEQDGKAGSLRAASNKFVKWRDLAVAIGNADDLSLKKEEKRLEDLVASRAMQSQGGRSKKEKGKSSLASTEDEETATHYYEDVYLSAINKQTAADVLEMITQYTLEEHDHQIDLAKNDVDRRAEQVSSRSLTPEAVSGVCIMLERFFTRSLGDLPLSTLLCDDVGLGKTGQIIGLISMVIHLYEAQCKGAPLPPFAIENDTHYFAGRERIPNLPSLILVPTTLSMQWQAQIKMATHHGALKILPYSSGPTFRRNFFAPGGTWEKAIGPEGCDARRTIVLAEYSSIAAEARTFLIPLPTGRSRPERLEVARGDPPQLMPGVNPGTTIFGKEFLLMAIDECHQLRNVSGFYSGALRLSANSLVHAGATATPIYTGAPDVPAQGRLLRVPGMIGDAGEQLCIDMETTERERTEDWNRNSQEILASMLAELPPLVDQTGVSGSSRPTQLSGEQIAQYESVYIAQGSIALAEKAMEGVLLRRTRESKDPEGNPVLSLEPYIYIVAHSPLSTVEYDTVLAIENAQVDGEELDGVMRVVKWSDFFMLQKHALMHWELVGLLAREKKLHNGAGTLTSRMTDDWTAENIYSKLSTRMLTLDKVLTYYWPGGKRPAFYKVDGSRDPKAEAQLTGFEPSPNPPKFVIFLIYKLHRDLVKKLFDIQGRRYMEYHGSLSQKQRDQVVEQFETDDSIRILIISNVGGTGLNLTVASIVIFMSGVWSGQERRQILGRLWRFGQKNRVIVIEVQAPKSIDVLLQLYANRKTLMSDIFLSNRARLMLARFGTPDSGTSDLDGSFPQADGIVDDDEYTADDTRVQVSRAPKRRRKDDDDADPLLISDPTPSKRPRKSNTAPKPAAERKRKPTALPGPPSKKAKSLGKLAPVGGLDRIVNVDEETSRASASSSKASSSSQGPTQPAAGERSSESAKIKSVDVTQSAGPSTLQPSDKNATVQRVRPKPKPLPAPSDIRSLSPPGSSPSVVVPVVPKRSAPVVLPPSPSPKATSTSTAHKVLSVPPELGFSEDSIQPAGDPMPLLSLDSPRQKSTTTMARPKPRLPPSSDSRSHGDSITRPSTIAPVVSVGSKPPVPVASPPSSSLKAAPTFLKPQVASAPAPGLGPKVCAAQFDDQCPSSSQRFAKSVAREGSPKIQGVNAAQLAGPSKRPSVKAPSLDGSLSAQSGGPMPRLQPPLSSQQSPGASASKSSIVLPIACIDSEPSVPVASPPPPPPAAPPNHSKSKAVSAPPPQSEEGYRTLRIWDMPKKPSSRRFSPGTQSRNVTPAPSGESVNDKAQEQVRGTATREHVVVSDLNPVSRTTTNSTSVLVSPECSTEPDRLAVATGVATNGLTRTTDRSPHSANGNGPPVCSVLPWSPDEIELQIQLGIYSPPREKASQPPGRLSGSSSAGDTSSLGSMHSALTAPPPFGPKAVAARNHVTSSSLSLSRRSDGPSTAPDKSALSGVTRGTPAPRLQAPKRPIATGHFARQATAQRLIVPDSPRAARSSTLGIGGSSSPPRVPEDSTVADDVGASVQSSSRGAATPSGSSIRKLPAAEPASKPSLRDIPAGQKMRFAKPSGRQVDAAQPSAEVRRKDGLMQERVKELDRRIQSRGGIRSPSREAAVSLPASRTQRFE